MSTGWYHPREAARLVPEIRLRAPGAGEGRGVAQGAGCCSASVPWNLCPALLRPALHKEQTEVLGVAASAPGIPRTHSGVPGLGSEQPPSRVPTYVNLPTSPASRKQLHYVGLELQEGSADVRGAGASRYAHVDIAATETLHRVAAQHAWTREARLPELEQGRSRARP